MSSRADGRRARPARSGDRGRANEGVGPGERGGGDGGIRVETFARAFRTDAWRARSRRTRKGRWCVSAKGDGPVVAITPVRLNAIFRSANARSRRAGPQGCLAHADPRRETDKASPGRAEENGQPTIAFGRMLCSPGPPPRRYGWPVENGRSIVGRAERLLGTSFGGPVTACDFCAKGSVACTVPLWFV